MNPLLVDWAFHLTAAVPLGDSDAMKAARSGYGYENARRPPFVLKGDTLSSGTYWHGKLLDSWANDWVQYHTGGKGVFVTTAMEDTGTLQSLTFLAKAGRADLSRVLVLRTSSNFDLTADPASLRRKTSRGRTWASTPLISRLSKLPGRVGNTVVSELVRNWDRYRENTP